MLNELLFGMHTLLVAIGSIGAWYLGKEALTAYVAILYLLANILITKQIALFGWYATATDAYIIGAALGINLLNEFYGKNYARLAVIITFCIAVLFIFLILAHLAYIPTPTDVYHTHFAAILKPEIRIIIASIIAYTISQIIEYTLYAFLKERFQSRFIIMRNWCTLAISQFVDTCLFTILGLYGILTSLGSVILVSYTLKLITIVCISPLLFLIKKLNTKNSNHA